MKSLNPILLPGDPSVTLAAGTKGYIDVRAVPVGGTIGQVVTKTGSGDYAVGWADPTGSGGGSVGPHAHVEGDVTDLTTDLAALDGRLDTLEAQPRTIRSQTDYDDDTAPTDGQLIGWVASTSKYTPTTVTASTVGADPTGTAADERADHEAAADPHPGYLTVSEGDAAYDSIGAASAARTAHEAASDPHPGYLTPTEGSAAYSALAHNHAGVYDPAGTAAAARTSHEAASDPHSGYLTPAEGDAAYAALSHAHAAGDVTSGTLAIGRIPTGQTSTTVPLGNDARFSDARTPTAHAASHAPGGSDDLSASYIPLAQKGANNGVAALTGSVLPRSYYQYANTTQDGSIVLTGDLGGTATSPTVPGLTTKVPTSRQVISGTGLTGGGALSADRTLAVSYGSTAGTAAQGDDARIVGAQQTSAKGSANGYASLDSAALVPIAQVPTGSSGTTVALGNHTHAAYVPTTRTLTAGTGLTGGGDLSADRSFAVAYGSAAGTAAQGDDARLSDARAPLPSMANAANGWAQLDGSALLPTSILPALAITDVFPVVSQAAMLALTAQRGDVAVRSDVSQTYILAAEPASTLGNWTLLPTPTDSVLSVNSQTGVVNLTAGDVGAAATSHAHAGADITSGTVGYARLPVGTGASTIAAGDDSRFTSAVAYSRLPVGTGASTVAAGDDSRITGAQQTSAKGAASGYASLDSSTLVPIAQLPTGTTSTTVAIGNDARLSDARTPTAHAASHASGGGDPITPASIGAAATGDSRFTDARTPTGAAGGSLAGTYPSPTIAAGVIGGAEIAAAIKDPAAATAGLRTLGTGAAQATAGNDARLSDSRAPNGTAGGDLTGTYPNPTIAAAIKDPVAGTAGLRTLGTGAQQATAGNDSRLSDARTPVAHNHAGTDVTTGTVGYARLPVGTAASTIAAGDDSRLSDARTPTGTAGGDLTGTYPNPTLRATLSDPAAGTAGLRTLGTGALQATAGNDSRLSDSRAPSGAAGGSLTGTYPNPTIAAGVVGSSEVAASIKDPSATLAGLRTLGLGAVQAAAGQDWRFPADGPTPASILNNGLRPGQNHYSVQMSRRGDAAVFTRTALDCAAGYEEPGYYEGNAAKTGVQMTAYVDAPTTGGSLYSRVEQREQDVNGADYVFDALDSGTHRQHGRFTITHLMAVKPEVVVAQLYNGSVDRVAIRTQLVSATVRLRIRINGSTATLDASSPISPSGTDVANGVANITNVEWEYLIEVVNGVTKVYMARTDGVAGNMVTPVLTSSALVSTGSASWYYKYGVYLQSQNGVDGDAASDYGSVLYRDVYHWHTGWATNAKYYTAGLHAATHAVGGYDDLSGYYQPLDADLTTIAGLTATTDNMIQSVGSAWASRTPAQVKTALALNSVDNTSDAGKPVSTAQQTALDGKRPLATPVNTQGNVTTWTVAVTAATAPGELFRATGNTATTTVAVPTGTPADGLSINLELLASTATSVVIHASILLAGGITTPIALASGKRWFGGLRYVSGVGWFLLASAVQS